MGQALEEIDAESVLIDPHPEVKRARMKLEAEEKRKQEEQEKKELEQRIKDDKKA